MTQPDSQFTHSHRNLTDADVDAMADALVQRLADRRTVEALTDAWGQQVDRALGRGLRRIGAWVLMLLLGVAALKFDLLAKLVAGIKP